ncbi:MAG TPA: hypothetical protein VL651_16340 [Bacteroidia bacterium]|jgi:dTMP kinase|nr:hypothetical protein [Bacteroidia bacterium]
MSSNKKLICITGADGTGKSTLIKNLVGHYHHAQQATIWDGLNAEQKQFGSKKEVDEYLCSLSPAERTLFLAHALHYSTDKAMASSASVIFLNAYWYKYFASELALGADEQLIFSEVKKFPEPDLVIELQLPVEKCAERKEKYSRYECGLAELPGKETFLAFQEQTKAQWNKFRKTEWKTIDASHSIEEIKNKAIQLIGIL